MKYKVSRICGQEKKIKHTNSKEMIYSKEKRNKIQKILFLQKLEKKIKKRSKAAYFKVRRLTLK